MVGAENKSRDYDQGRQNHCRDTKLHMPGAFAGCHKDRLPKQQHQKGAHENGVDVVKTGGNGGLWPALIAATLAKESGTNPAKTIAMKLAAVNT